MSYSKIEAKERRHTRVRKKVVGTPAKPRLNVFRSLDHIYAQVIDDFAGITLATASTIDKDLKGKVAVITGAALVLTGPSPSTTLSAA